MMSNNVFIVNNFGAICFAAEDAWQEYCAKHDIKDPWREMRYLRLKNIRSTINIDGMTSFEINEDDETEKKIKQWEAQVPYFRQVRDLWKLEWIFENEGYDAASKFAHMENNETNRLSDTFDSLMPCKYNDECSLMCQRFERCIKEGFIENGT